MGGIRSRWLFAVEIDKVRMIEMIFGPWRVSKGAVHYWLCVYLTLVLGTKTQMSYVVGYLTQTYIDCTKE